MSFFRIHTSTRTAVFFSAFLLLGLTGWAQGSAGPGSGSSLNWLEILLVATAIVLVFVIWGMGQVLLVLGKKIQEKHRASLTKAATILIGLFTWAGAQAQDAAAPVASSSNYGGLPATEFWALASVSLLETLIIFILAFLGRRMYRALTGAAEVHREVSSRWSFAEWWSRMDKKFMTRAVPVEKEADVLLDHDYDGIRELDNALPPWWKYGFYVTVVVAVIYMFNFHVFGYGKNPEQEYMAEMEAGKRMEEAYKAKTKNLVDENNVTLADAAGISEGEKLYKQSCVACHGANGEGGIGPNLTDAYWIHGGSLNDIYKTIKLGYPEKGMQSWESMFTPVQMKDLTSYVKSIKGTNPANAKAPQGEEYRD